MARSQPLARRAWPGISLGVAMAVVTLLSIRLAAQQEDSPAPPYRILVTNDDGIGAPGLRALVKALSRVAEVTVSAPLENRSGSSHSVTTGTLRVRPVTLEGATSAVGVDGTPADAVRFGLLALAGERSFDLVVSGINRGANVGNVAHYSGTVGAAMEAIYQEVPAVAVSQDAGSRDYSQAADLTARLVRELRHRGAPPKVVLSVNVPAAATRQISEVVAAPMGGSYFSVTGYRRQDRHGRAGEDQIWQTQLRLRAQATSGSDTHAYLAGKVTITPLRFDWTEPELVTDLRLWVGSLAQGTAEKP